MAYLDMMSPDAFGRYNIKFAQIAGLNTAVYWSLLMTVLDRVYKKKKYDEQGFFTLDRSYVTAKTTLTEPQQIECDAELVKLGLMAVDPIDQNKIAVDMKGFASIVIEDDIKTIANITKAASKATKAGKAEGKRAGIICRLTNRVTENDPELFDLYEKLLDACYSKGLQTNAQIDLFQDTLNSYTSDKEVKAEILKIAVAKAYRDVTWAISIYEKDHTSKSATRLGEQKICTGLDSTEF